MFPIKKAYRLMKDISCFTRVFFFASIFFHFWLLSSSRVVMVECE
jgi:hypothetical protein